VFGDKNTRHLFYGWVVGTGRGSIPEDDSLGERGLKYCDGPSLKVRDIEGGGIVPD
jgi:hypothetical protein